MISVRTALAILFATASGPAFATAIVSNFTDGDEGWRHGTYHSSPQAAVIHNPAGHIEIDNGWYAGGFLAPTKFLGNQSSFVNGAFSFQLSTDQSPTPDAQFPALILVGDNGQSIFANHVGAPGSALTDFSINLTAESFYKGSIEERVSGVTTEEFASILANLEKLSIFGDWSGGEVLRLDNVRMSAAAVTAVPEPASWAMMIVGFGTLGAAIRRRPVKLSYA